MTLATATWAGHVDGSQGGREKDDHKNRGWKETRVV